MSCTYRNADGTVCNAEVNNQSDGKPFMFCRNCSNAMNTARKFPRMPRNIVLCNYVGYLPDSTKLPFKCIAGANNSGFCFHHANLMNKTVTGEFATSNVNTNAAKVNVSAVTKGPAKNNKPVPTVTENTQVKNQLAKLDESDVEDFGVSDVINKLKANNKTTKASKEKESTKEVVKEPAKESHKEAESKSEKPESKPSKSEKAETKESKKSKTPKEDDDTNIEPEEFDVEAAEAKRAEDKAARKAEKAKLLEKIAAKEAKKKAKEAAAAEAAKAAQESEESSEEPQPEPKKKEKKAKK